MFGGRTRIAIGLRNGLRILSCPRSFLKRPGAPNIPIQAIGLSLYEDLGKDGPVETLGTKVTRTQWLDLSSLEMANLIGKNVLIVDEVDDTRTTLEYAVRELEKDVELAQKQLGREGEKTTFSVFVLHVSVGVNCSSSGLRIQAANCGHLCVLYRTKTRKRKENFLPICSRKIATWLL